MARKTVDLDVLVGACNSALAVSDESLSGPMAADPRSFRLGVIAACEQALHMADAYKGFKYQSSEWNGDGSGLRTGYDDTRREYYV